MSRRPFFGYSTHTWLPESTPDDSLATARRRLEQIVASNEEQDRTQRQNLDAVKGLIGLGNPRPEAIFPARVLVEAGIVPTPEDGGRATTGSNELCTPSVHGPASKFQAQSPSIPLDGVRNKQAAQTVLAHFRPAPSYLSDTGNPVIPFKTAKPLHYKSKGPNFMARFLKTVHRRTDVAKRVTSLTFTLPHDSLYSSGVLALLASASADKPDSDSAENEVPHLVIAAEKIALQLAIFQSPERIPLKIVLELYVYLFSVCSNVQKIEIPWTWENDFRLWEGVLRRVKGKDITICICNPGYDLV